MTRRRSERLSGVRRGWHTEGKVKQVMAIAGKKTNLIRGKEAVWKKL